MLYGLTLSFVIAIQAAHGFSQGGAHRGLLDLKTCDEIVAADPTGNKVLGLVDGPDKEDAYRGELLLICYPNTNLAVKERLRKLKDKKGPTAERLKEAEEKKKAPAPTPHTEDEMKNYRESIRNY